MIYKIKELQKSEKKVLQQVHLIYYTRTLYNVKRFSKQCDYLVALQSDPTSRFKCETKQGVK